MEWVILLSVGLLASSLGSLIGLGGGIIVVPALLYFGGLSWFGHVSPQDYACGFRKCELALRFGANSRCLDWGKSWRLFKFKVKKQNDCFNLKNHFSNSLHTTHL